MCLFIISSAERELERDGKSVVTSHRFEEGRSNASSSLLRVTSSPQTERTVPLGAPTKSHFSRKSLVDHDRQELSAVT